MPEPPRRVLLIHLKRVGDILLTTPAIARARRLFPRARLEFLVYPEFAEILRGNPNLDEVVLYPKAVPWRLPGLLHARRYDLVVDFLADGASAWASLFSRASWRVAFSNKYPAAVHNVKIPRPQETLYAPLQKIRLLDRAAELLGVSVAAPPERFPKPELYVDEARRSRWEEAWSPLGKQGPRVALSPQSRRATRRWHLEGFARVAAELADKRGAGVAVLWGPGERDQAEEVARRASRPRVQAAPAFGDIQELGAFLSHAALLITNCNGTKHAAVALGVPTVTIHMSSNPRVWNPPAPDGSLVHPRHPVVRAEDLFCIGCQKNECPYHLECAALATPEAVLQEANRLLDV